MVGANYTGGRRNAAKARSKDTTGRLQRGHFSKQRLGILADALRSRRPDHHPLARSRPSAVADNPNLTSNPRSGSLISPSGYPTSAPAATVYDISLGHAKRDLAQKQLRFHLNTDGLRSPSLQPGPSVLSDSPAVTPLESSTSLALDLTGKGEPNPEFSPRTLLRATTSAAVPSCATSPSQSHTLPQQSPRPEPAFGRGSLTEKPPTPVTTGLPSKPRSKILDLIDISDPASVRAQIDRILAFPSLLGVSRCSETRGPSLSADIDNDNATAARSDREECHAVTDLQSVHPLADSLHEAVLFPPVTPPKTRNQMPVRQDTRHKLHPSDPSPATINQTDPDRDRGQHRQPTPLAHPLRSSSAIPNSPGSGIDRDGDGRNRSIAASDLVVGTAAEIGTYVPPRGRQRDFQGTPDWMWERNPNPNPEGNAKPERGMKMHLNEDDTNVNGGVQSDVNLEFGSRTVAPLSLPRVKNSISDWGECELASPGVGKGSRTEVETPPSKLALALFPQPSVFREMGVGDSIHGGHTRSAFQPHVRVPDVPRHAEFRFSPTDVRPLIGEDRQQERDKPPEAVGPSDLDNLSPGSPSSNSGTRSCSTTAGSSSSRTELFPGSGSPPIRDGYGSTAHALRRRLRSDGLNEMGAGKTKMGGGGSENELGGRMGFMNGRQLTRRLSEISIDDMDGGGEFDWTGLGGVGGRVERCAWVDDSQDWDALSSRCSSADADVGSGFRSPPIGPPLTVHLQSRYPALTSDRGSILESHLWHHVEGQSMGDVLSPGSRYHLVSHHTPISGTLEAHTPLLSLTSPEAALYTHDTGVPRNNAELNAYQSTSWPTQTQENVHPHAREFDTLRFSSSSPSRTISVSASPSISVPRRLLSDEDKLDEDRDSEPEGSGSGFIERLPLNAELRSDMKANMTPNSNTRTGLNGNAERVLLNRATLAPPTLKVINNRADGDGSVAGHMDRIQRGDMGGLRREKLRSLGVGRRTSPVSISVSGVSGVSVADSLYTPDPVTGSHRGDEDTRSAARPDSRAMSAQSRSTDREEPHEECELLKSLLESSDPWGLMRRKVLNLPSPTPLEIERRNKRGEDVVKGSFGRRGVGYVTPPSMDALLGAAGSGADMEMEVVDEGGGGDEDSQEILDFRSSQPRMDHLSLFRRTHRIGDGSLIQSTFRSLPETHCGSSASGLPPSDFASTSTTMDTFSDPLGFPSSGLQFRSYRETNRDDDDRHNLGSDLKLHVAASSPRSGLQSRRDEMGQSTRKRARRSSDSEGSQDFTFTDHDLVKVGGRELSVTPSPSKFESDPGVVVPKRPSQSLPGNSGIDDVDVTERTLRHTWNEGRTNSPTIVVPGRGGRDPSPALGDAKTGVTSVTDELNATTATDAGPANSPAAVGSRRARKSPRTIGPLPLGRSGKVERLVVGSSATEQRDEAGNHQVETEEETRKAGKWGESGHRTATNTNFNINPSESDGGGSNSNPQRGGLVRNDRFEDRDCETEGCGPVPGREVREGKGVDLGPSPRRRDDWECGASDLEPLRINRGEGTGCPGGTFALPAPTDPYLDFALGLDGTTLDDSERTNGALVTTELDYPSVSETLRHLESTMGLPVGTGVGVDPTLMNPDAILSVSVPRLRSGDGETQSRGLLGGTSLSQLPFYLSTSKPQILGYSFSSSSIVAADGGLTLTPPNSSLSPKAPVEVIPQTPRISTTVSGSGLTWTPRSVECVSAMTNLDSAKAQMFAGPSLFLGDDGME